MQAQLTANNGILICALLFWWGVVAADKWMMAAALSAAGLSWLINAMDEHEAAGGVRQLLFGLVLASIVLGYAVAALHFFGLR